METIQVYPIYVDETLQVGIELKEPEVPTVESEDLADTVPP